MLYRFHFDLSDIDRSIYQALDFRVAQHPSETMPYLLTRVLAYSLSYQDGLEFSPEGLGNPDAPALQALGQHGTIELWIEIGNPSARKLHKATKAAKNVVVYTYKDPEVLAAEIRANSVHRGSEIQIYCFDSKFLSALERQTGKNNKWSVLYQQGHLDIGMNGADVATDVTRVSV